MSSPVIPHTVATKQDQSSLENQLLCLHDRPGRGFADVLFTMPNLHGSIARNTIPLPSQIWAHSALLAMTYSKPLSRLGQVYSSSLECGDDKREEYTIVAVSSENDLVVRKLVASCYRPVVVRNLWEKMDGKREMLAALDEGMLYPCGYTRTETDYSEDDDTMTSTSTSPESALRGDMTLKIEGETVSFTVHKFLLDLRVPYFSIMLRSGFADATMAEHTLSSEYFTPLSLAIVTQYIYLDDAELLFSWKWTDFARYLYSTKCTTDINPPSAQVFDMFVDALVAAKFLQLESLENWITNCLLKIGHGFACTGAQCARHLPGIAIIGYQQNIPELYHPCVAWLARHSNISFLWKRNLLALPPELRSELVDDVKAKVALSNVIPLYLRLYNLRKNTETSAFKDDWEQSLLAPLLAYCGDFVSMHFAEPRIVFSSARGIHHKPPSVTYSAVEDLFARVASKISKQNATAIWRGADCHTKLTSSSPVVEDLNAKVIAWFKLHWKDLVVPLSTATNDQDVVGFNTWPDESLLKLSTQIKIPLADLKGLGSAAKIFEQRKEKWLEKCRVEEVNRLMRRRELVKPTTGSG
ncbi:hypothetical protein V1512DRAFT_258105 [Lipomyces arxii]|uniref:uncharacterized protein n=1 Tax=Lipomyces arxii TaxID=56418 RepID=UPI0034CE98C9